MHREYVDVRIEKEIYEILKYWNEKRKEDMKNGNNRMTGNPMYRVESQRWEECTEEYADKSTLKMMGEEFTLEQIQNGDMEDCIWYMDSEKIDEIKEMESLEDVVEFLTNNGWDSDPLWIEHEKITYDHKAVFFTHDEAKKYIEYQGHNLTNPRIYISGTGYDNRGTLARFLNIVDCQEIFEFTK